MEVPHRRGKLKAINNFDEQLFLLLTFLHHGSTTLTLLLSTPFYETQNALVRLLHSIVSHIRAPLADLFLTFRPDRIEVMKEVGIVLDCTIIPINRPGGRLDFGKKFFSGKHHTYCVKAEVGVNPKVGTASTISAIHSGSTHDFTVFKDHYPQFLDRLGGAKILADSAYIGARPDLAAIITKPVGTPELATHRVIVERFFGRLKTLFSVFRRQWPFEVERVADYFCVACCLTNFHILRNPLTRADGEANQRILDNLWTEHLQKQKARQIANERYRIKLKNRLNPSLSITPTITTLHAQIDNISQNEKEGELKKKCEEEKKEKRKIEEKEEKEEKDRNETKRIDLEENDSDEDDNSMAWCLPGQWKSIQHSSASSSSPFPSTPRSSEAEKAKRITPSPLRLLLEQRN